MATIYNSNLTRELVEGAKIQVSKDAVPNKIADKVVPVMETNPNILVKDLVLVNMAHTTSQGSTTTMRVADANNDTYITGYSINVIKDATCDVATGNKTISIVQDGATVVLAYVPVITTTAQNIHLSQTFLHPIKIDRNTAITFTSFSYTAGTSVRGIVLYGYQLFNVRA